MGGCNDRDRMVDRSRICGRRIITDASISCANVLGTASSGSGCDDAHKGSRYNRQSPHRTVSTLHGSRAPRIRTRDCPTCALLMPKSGHARLRMRGEGAQSRCRPHRRGAVQRAAKRLSARGLSTRRGGTAATRARAAQPPRPARAPRGSRLPTCCSQAAAPRPCAGSPRRSPARRRCDPRP